LDRCPQSSPAIPAVRKCAGRQLADHEALRLVAQTENLLTLYAKRNTSHVMTIQSFKCPETKTLYETGQSRVFGNIASVSCRKLDMLNAAAMLKDLRSPPGNRLEALQPPRSGQHSIRINDQWRICFVWTSAGPNDVEIVDYH
jgi:toxin HigB-1